MKKAKAIFILTKNLSQAFLSCVKIITVKENCFWTINETFFIGENAAESRDNFQVEYNDLVKKYKL